MLNTHLKLFLILFLLQQTHLISLSSKMKNQCHSLKTRYYLETSCQLQFWINEDIQASLYVEDLAACVVEGRSFFNGSE